MSGLRSACYYYIYYILLYLLTYGVVYIIQQGPKLFRSFLSLYSMHSKKSGQAGYIYSSSILNMETDSSSDMLYLYITLHIIQNRNVH